MKHVAEGANGFALYSFPRRVRIRGIADGLRQQNPAPPSPSLPPPAEADFAVGLALYDAEIR